MIIPRGGASFPGMTGFRLVPEVKISTFFDRTDVLAALTKMEFRALTRASLLVRRTAQKSIKKMGMAKPKLRVTAAYPDMKLKEIVRLPTAARTGGGRVSKRDRAAAIKRIQEIKAKDPSPAGTPPNTHVPFGHMLGFRRNLYNAYDSSTHSAVVGPSKKGRDWQIPQLHEFGGTRRLVGYVWRPRWERYTKPIVRWVSPMTTMGDDWIPLGKTKNVSYPARPYMRPALEQNRGKIAEMFRGTFGK